MFKYTDRTISAVRLRSYQFKTVFWENVHYRILYNGLFKLVCKQQTQLHKPVKLKSVLHNLLN